MRTVFWGRRKRIPKLKEVSSEEEYRVRSGEGDRQNRRNRNNPYPVSNNNNNAGGRMNNTAARRRSSGPRNNNVMQPIRVKNGGIMVSLFGNRQIIFISYVHVFYVL